jgi:hypothetical protein
VGGENDRVVKCVKQIHEDQDRIAERGVSTSNLSSRGFALPLLAGRLSGKLI